jgi:monovalent cation:H+ antiporter-2, CPA2 family
MFFRPSATLNLAGSYFSSAMSASYDLRREKNTYQISTYRWGNASRPGFLARCGLAKARALVIAMDRPADAEDIVRDARAGHPDLVIVARARDAHHATRLYGLGVSDAVPETIEASLQLSEAVLVDMGIPMGKVIASIHEKRDEFRKILQPIAGRAEPRQAIKMSVRMREINKRPPKSKTEE